MRLYLHVLRMQNVAHRGAYVRKKTAQLRTDGATLIRASVGALWGSKQLDNLVDLRLSFEVAPEKAVLRRREEGDIRNQYVFCDLTVPPV